jgi:hypothetical protein
MSEMENSFSQLSGDLKAKEMWGLGILNSKKMNIALMIK